MICLEKQNSIGILKLNNPPHNQILQPQFIKEKELHDFIKNNHLKALLITGTGRHFSNGADLEELKNIICSGQLAKEIDKGKAILNYIENLEIPVLAAVNGICFGGGLEIALAAHLIIASESALFALPEINHNLIPGLGGTQRMIRRIGKAKTLEVIFTGDTINAEKALDFKLVDYIIPKKDLLPYSYDLLNRLIDSRSIKVINYVMRSLKNYYTLPFEEALAAETALFCDLALDKLNREDPKQDE
ncbi:MAG: enoyl-CoA hydratase/isomerase family protein [Spirochaetes bacterium]|nr:enoyl-CoA hydratase/isomerase family protein [Spirochaetota bacterium]